MFDWFRKKPLPLTGAPPVRRVKTYSAQSGYVYQYYYQGYRPASGGIEYVFDVSSDRKTSAPVSVFVNDEAVAAWQDGHGRTLSSTERYAVAKMALFQAFDERPTPESMREEVNVRAGDLEAFLAALDIE